MRGPVLEVAFVPLGEWLPWLAAGWTFGGLAVGPMAGYHGNFACLLVREPADA